MNAARARVAGNIRMLRLKLTLAYTGTRYAGWQLQAPDLKKSTIQGELEAVVSRIAGIPIRVHGAGRTDSGVHAEGQVAHMDVPDQCRDMDWRRACNAALPRDIRILDARPATPSFHARHDAAGKLYAYSLCMHRSCIPPRLHGFVWPVRNLNRQSMREAAELLRGSHDFASFRNAGTDCESSTVRALVSVTEEPGRAAAFLCPPDWPVSTWFFHGDGFLKQMVRNLMGLLVWVGKGAIRPDEVPAIIAAGNRAALPSPTAPAEGLTLMRVDYRAPAP